jgi:hypothetical protein
VLRASFLCSLFFSVGPALDDLEGAKNFLAWITHWALSDEKKYVYPIFIDRPFFGALADPIADLCRLPLPKKLSPSVRQNTSNEISLYHALVSFVGSPGSLQSNRSLCELVLFSATWVVAHNDRPTVDTFGRLRKRWSRSPIQAATVQLKMDRGWNWLREHLPKIRFALEVEQAIDRASDLKYEVEVALGVAG